MGYMEAVEKTGTATEGEEQIDSKAHFLEQIMLGLRQRQGVEAFVVETHQATQAQLHYLLNHQLLERVDNRIRLTRHGLLLADEVCAELVKNS
jgi:coproporphyrinogen III oxidase-like Fe-S oxidoreductase